MGGPGAGYTSKHLINLLWFVHVVASTEVLTMGVKAGVDLETLRLALLASPARSNFLEHDVRVVSAQTERANACDARCAARPRPGL